MLELTTHVAPEVTPAKNKNKKTEQQDLNLHFPCSSRKCREGNLNRNLTIAFYSFILLKRKNTHRRKSENFYNLERAAGVFMYSKNKLVPTLKQQRNPKITL